MYTICTYSVKVLSSFWCKNYEEFQWKKKGMLTRGYKKWMVKGGDFKNITVIIECCIENEANEEQKY